jgi:hypothetical protein
MFCLPTRFVFSVDVIFAVLRKKIDNEIDRGHEVDDVSLRRS